MFEGWPSYVEEEVEIEERGGMFHVVFKSGTSRIRLALPPRIMAQLGRASGSALDDFHGRRAKVISFPGATEPKPRRGRRKREDAP